MRGDIEYFSYGRDGISIWEVDRPKGNDTEERWFDIKKALCRKRATKKNLTSALTRLGMSTINANLLAKKALKIHKDQRRIVDSYFSTDPAFISTGRACFVVDYMDELVEIFRKNKNEEFNYGGLFEDRTAGGVGRIIFKS